MKAIRTVCVPVERMCHIEFYVWADEVFDNGHSFVLENAYFETREEAEALMKKHSSDWCEFRICEKVTPIED